jgi:hypothetical protein
MSERSGKAAMTRRIMMNTMVASATIVAVPAIAQAAPDATAELLDLQEQIFEADEAANAHRAEIERLHGIIGDEVERLYDDWRSNLTAKERWALVTAMPESKEHDRLVRVVFAQCAAGRFSAYSGGGRCIGLCDCSSHEASPSEEAPSPAGTPILSRGAAMACEHVFPSRGIEFNQSVMERSRSLRNSRGGPSLGLAPHPR